MTYVCVRAFLLFFFLQGLNFCDFVPYAKIKTSENQILVIREEIDKGKNHTWLMFEKKKNIYST